MKWGNALGGYKTQPRSKGGQFSHKIGPALNHKNLHAKAKKRGGGVVPYRRHGLGHNTAGVNAGLSITKNRRVSFGVYVRTDTKSGAKKSKHIAKSLEIAQKDVAGRVPSVPGVETTGAKLKVVKKLSSKAFRGVVGNETKVNEATYRRVGTDRNGLPTLIYRYNSPKDQKSRSNKKRNRSVVLYNTHSVTGKRTYDWANPKSRPARRGNAKKTKPKAKANSR